MAPGSEDYNTTCRGGHSSLVIIGISKGNKDYSIPMKPRLWAERIQGTKVYNYDEIPRGEERRGEEGGGKEARL